MPILRQAAKTLARRGNFMSAEMVARLYAMRASYWFIPGVMALVGVLMALVTTSMESSLGARITTAHGWFAFNTANGARALLSTIAGSMIGVAGVTFSITIAALAYATSQLGPRLLRNFMRDRGIQLTLGTFIATFIYCLMVLRTVASRDETNDLSAFVPHLGVLVAMGWAVASVVAFIFFIHHAPKSIQASNLIGQIGGELMHKARELFPEQVGETELEEGVAETPEGGTPLRSPSTGYIVSVDLIGLLALAEREDMMIRMVRSPGDFVSDGEVVAWVHGTASEETMAQAAAGFATGDERTQTQDVLFIVQQLVEVAARALSPGLNDPFTAIGVLDWMGAGLMEIGRRARPVETRRGTDGKLRVIAPAAGFQEIAAAGLGQLRPYASVDRNAALHMMGVIARIAERVEHPPYRRVLREQAEALRESAGEKLDEPARRRLDEGLAAVRRVAGGGATGGRKDKETGDGSGRRAAE